MAKPKTMNGTSLLVKIGDGGGPEVFTHTCLINAARGIQFTSTTNDVIVPDCADPEAPGWLERNKDGLGATITGAGVLATDLIEDFFNWYKGKDTRNIQVAVNVAGADGGGHWAMASHLTEFEVTGERANKAQFTCTILSDGEATWVDAA